MHTIEAAMQGDAASLWTFKTTVCVVTATVWVVIAPAWATVDSSWDSSTWIDYFNFYAH